MDTVGCTFHKVVERPWNAAEPLECRIRCNLLQQNSLYRFHRSMCSASTILVKLYADSADSENATNAKNGADTRDRA